MQAHCPDELHNAVLDEAVEQLRNTLLSRSPTPTAATNKTLLDTWLLPVCCVSSYFANTARQYPFALQRLMDEKVLLEGSVPDCHVKLTEELEQDLLAANDSSAALMDQNALLALQQQVLRLFRHRHMMRILWCDLTSVYSLEQTLQALSSLAQACVIAADQWSHAALVKRFGQPVDAQGKEQRLIVLGMGKLGGRELNVSSDIDLICLFPQSGNTKTCESGARSIDNGDFFRRLVQRLSKLLHSVTQDGFVYRVDTRLRPFGESGPLVMNLDGLEHYLLTQARDWERYAMIKARALCGNAQDIDELQLLITPFVYRRYLDYNAFQALRDLKRKIALSVRQKSMHDNIKLGAGGIREIEFIGQAFQLVRGGRDARLRIRPIMKVLTQLAEQNLMSTTDVQSLKLAYQFFRRVENALQMMRDEQTHSLPSDPEDRIRLLAIMEQISWPAFQAVLEEHHARVSEIFNHLFETENEPAQNQEAAGDLSVDDSAIDLWGLLSSDAVEESEKRAVLQKAGFDADDALLGSVDSLSRSSFHQRLTAQSQQRIERIMPMIIGFAAESEQSDQALSRTLALVRSVAGRSAYLQVLGDQPKALQRLVNLFAQSAWLANFVARQPIVIDELLVSVSDALYIDSAQMHANTNSLVQRLTDCELDEQMDALRQYRQAQQMRLACAQLEGTLSVMQVSDQLSWLAQSLIAAVMILVEKPLLERHGFPGYKDAEGRQRKASVAVVAYGKLGGLELGFGSDLDLVFLHDSFGTVQETDGEKSVPNTVFYVRLTQKFVHFMSTTTPAGILYEIDLRLRPNGSSGVLVTGVDSFANYQDGDAWVWEHQALIRARMVYGDAALKRQFDQVRQRVLAARRSHEELRTAVSSMRKRMRDALGNKDSSLMHLKQDAGGVADIEFIVQFLVLAHAHSHPDLLKHTDNIRILDCVQRLNLLSESQCHLLRDSYLSLRERLHRLSLSESPSLVPLDAELKELAEQVGNVRDQVLGPN